MARTFVAAQLMLANASLTSWILPANPSQMTLPKIPASLPASSNFYLPCQKCNWLHTVSDKMQTPQLSNSDAPQLSPQNEVPKLALSPPWRVPKLTRQTRPLTLLLVPDLHLEWPFPDYTQPILPAWARFPQASRVRAGVVYSSGP